MVMQSINFGFLIKITKGVPDLPIRDVSFHGKFWRVTGLSPDIGNPALVTLS
jgi:hypothetical protein